MLTPFWFYHKSTTAGVIFTKLCDQGCVLCGITGASRVWSRVSRGVIKGVSRVWSRVCLVCDHGCVSCVITGVSGMWSRVCLGCDHGCVSCVITGVSCVGLRACLGCDHGCVWDVITGVSGMWLRVCLLFQASNGSSVNERQVWKLSEFDSAASNAQSEPHQEANAETNDGP